MIRPPPTSTLFPSTPLFRSIYPPLLSDHGLRAALEAQARKATLPVRIEDRKSTRLNSSHQIISYAVFCLKKKKKSVLSCSRAERALQPTEVDGPAPTPSRAQ